MVDALTFPIPISHIQGRYLLFDINAIAHLREQYRICGVFIGTLPQNPSQNVFMGLPMELMPEEAQLLIDEAVCYILDDPRAHDLALAKAKANRQRQDLYVKDHEAHATEIAKEKSREKEIEKRKALKKIKAKQGVDSMRSSTETVTADTSTEDSTGTPKPDSDPLTETTESLFGPDDSTDHIDTSSSPSLNQSQQPTTSLTITPATSTILLPVNPDPISTSTSNPTTTPALSHNRNRIPNLSQPSYTLYKHLNTLSYFQTPGLRFGCQFCVYPGDPLRFHSHFLAVGYGWDEEIDLMDVVGGGRLGTGVKKGWLVGGREKVAGRAPEEGRVRTWSVEWAGM